MLKKLLIISIASTFFLACKSNKETAASAEKTTTEPVKTNETKELSKAVNEMLFEWTKSSGTSKDPAEDELKKRRKRKKL